MQFDELVDLTVTLMDNVKEEGDRLQMSKYMKDKFDFFGVKSPARKDVQRELKAYLRALDNESIFQYAETLWLLPQRELQYIALEALGSRSKKWDESYLGRIEHLIVTKSWWDTVDSLAPNIAGAIFFKDEELRLKWIEKWINSDNMWLNRSALIHQLRYRDQLNLDLLFALVESHIGSKEFFINKASGWALRQASKFYPSEIKTFINNHPNLSTLTKREGSKYLN